MKKSYSIPEIPTLLSQIAPAGILVSVTTNSISHLIKTTRGKEKLLSLFQYSAELFKLTMLDYCKKKSLKDHPVHLINSIQIEKSMKNGRKLMRVLMFLDDFAYIEKSWKTWRKFDFLEVLQIALNLANIVYYLLDNLVWCSDIGIISKFVAHANIKWKDTKDLSSLARATLGLVISIVSSSRAYKKIKEYREYLGLHEDKNLKKSSKKMLKIENLLSARRQYGFKILEVFNMLLRLTMIGHGLKFPILRNFSKVFIAICGITATSLSIFNTLIGEQIVTIKSTPKIGLETRENSTEE